MTPKEVSKEIFLDLELVKISLDRLTKEYDRERRRNKIKKEDSYYKPYEIKTKKKNNWVLILCKAPGSMKYKGLESINILLLVYYYTDIGLRAFHISHPGNLSVYNGHLFKRYNERMQLGLSNHLDIMKHYFLNNGGYGTGFITPKEHKDYIFATCKEGIILGELHKDMKWNIYKTFISRDILGPTQEHKDNELIHLLQDEIKEELNSPDFKQDDYFYHKLDFLSGIQ